MSYLRADECQLYFDWLVLTLTYNGLMALICLILQIQLYLFIRCCIDYSANTNSYNTGNETGVPVVAATAAIYLSSGYCCEQHAESNNSRHRSTFISCPSGQKLSWLMEMRGAKILTVGILPFCFINLPSSLSGVVIHFVAKNLGNDYVGWLRILMVALRELILLHLIYIPAVFSVQSREFRLSSRRCCRCCFRKRKRRRRRNQLQAGPEAFRFAWIVIIAYRKTVYGRSGQKKKCASEPARKTMVSIKNVFTIVYDVNILFVNVWDFCYLRLKF